MTPTMFLSHDEARRANLLQANAVRSARSRLKLDLKKGSVNPLDVLADPPELSGGMLAFDFLMALPLVGKAKALYILHCAHVGTTRTLGSLTDRERLALASWMRRA